MSKEDATVDQVVKAGQEELLAGTVQEERDAALPRDFGETRNPEVIRNRPNPDPHYGNPGPNPIHPLTKAQQASVASAAERSLDADEVTSEAEKEENEAEEKQLKAALKSARQETGSQNRQG